MKHPPKMKVATATAVATLMLGLVQFYLERLERLPQPNVGVVTPVAGSYCAYYVPDSFEVAGETWIVTDDC